MRTILSRITVITLFLLSSLSIMANADRFSFATITDVRLNTLIISNVATITGFDSTVSIRIEGGTYIIGAGNPTSTNGAIIAGATVAVQVLSSSEFNTQTVATLTVGSGNSVTSAIFSVTTRPAPSSPVFTSTPIISARVNSLYRYNLDASDADSNNLIFSAASGTELPNWLAIDLFVTTLAGKGLAGSDDGTTSIASFNSPAGVAIDASGNIIVADTINHRIRSITPGGVVTTIAGAGPTGATSGSFADGASATARFRSPRGVAIDASGNIIIADVGNHRIRNIAPDGMVTTIAGSETSFADGASATARFNNPVGVAVDASGNIIIADTNNHRIRRISAGGTVTTIAGSSADFADGASATAMFFSPTGIAIDALGNIIVADSINSLIRRISTDDIVSTIAGSVTGFADGASATAKFSFPTSVAIDISGNTIVVDTGNNRIRNISPDGIVTTIAGSGTGFADGVSATAKFWSPTDIAIDAGGNIIVADQVNNRIRKIDKNNLIGTPSCSDIGIYGLELIVSDGELQSSQSFDITVTDDGSCGAIPTNLTLSTTTIFEGILVNSIIATISADDNNPASLTFSIIGGEDSASFSISGGNQLVIDHSPDSEVQNIYEIIISVSDAVHIATKSFEINVVGTESIPVFTSVPIISAKANSLYQYSLSASDVDSANLVFSVAPGTVLPSWLVIDAFVTTVAGDGSRDDDDGATSTASFDLPRSVAIDANGNIIVADANNHRIRSISTEGVVRTIAGSSTSGFVNGASATAKFSSPRGVTIDAFGNIIVADRNNHSIRKITPDGIVTTIAGSNTFGTTDGASVTARFRSPIGVAIDVLGNIIVTDQNNHRIRSIDPDGMVSTIAGSGIGSTDGARAAAKFNQPWGVTIDALGNIIVADSRNNRIRSISADDMVRTIAGSNTGFTDSTSIAARFNNPTGVAVDAGGNIIVADSRNNRIRSIAPDGVVTTIAGSSAGFTDGVASNAEFFRPVGVAIDASGNIIIADQSNSRIRKIDKNNLVGTPSCNDIGIHNLDLSVNDGIFQNLQSFDITVVDDGSCGIIPTNLALNVTTIVESILANSVIATISATATNPLNPFEFSIVGGRDSASFSISAGNQLVIDHSPDFDAQNSYEIIIGVSDTVHIATKSFEINVVATESIPVFTSTPIITTRARSLYQYNLSASDAEGGNFVFSAAPDTELPSWLAIDAVVTTLAGTGSPGDDNGASATAEFNSPTGVAIDASGNIIVADSNNSRIRGISLGGMVSTIAGNGEFSFVDGASDTASFRSPRGVTIDASGNIIVADRNNNRIRSIDASGVVNTIAGSGEFSFVDGASDTASFRSPTGVAIGALGNIVVADSNNHRIRNISPDGTVTTIAGGESGFADGASATAEFSSPVGVAIDTGVNIIIADASNHSIRNITLDGTVTTIAGISRGFTDGASATAEFSSPVGVAIDGVGNIIVADNNNHSIRSIAPDGTVTTVAGSSLGFADGIGGDAQFFGPFGIAIDASGNIIVADQNNHSIRKIDRNNFILVGTPSCDDIGTYNLELIVSDGEFQSSQIFDINVADDGSCGIIPTNLALSVTAIVENILANSIIATISAYDSDNPASLTFSIVGGRDSASFSISGDNQLVIDHSPDFDTQNSYEIIISASDTVHIATKSFEINVVATESIPIFTSTPIISAKTNSLYQYSLSASDVEGGNFVFSAAPDSDSPIWLAIGAAVTTLAGDGSRDDDDGATSTASFDLPRSVAIDAIGNIIVADANNHRIRSISTEGVVRTIAGSSTSGFVNGASTTARFNSPRDVTIDALGNIIVADRGNHSIRKITPDGMVSTIAGSNTVGSADGASATARFSSPIGVTIDAFGNIIVTDQNNHRIRSIDPDGMVSTIAGSDIGFADGASATAEFDRPWGVTIDVLGNIIVADSANNRIRSISTDGIVSTIAGSNTVGTADGASATARFNNPTGVAVDAGGNIIVTDSRNNRIRSIDPDGIVTTIAGSSAGFTDGVASNAEFFRPVGVAIDASGNIIIADQSNSRIRQIDRNNFTLVGTPSCDDIGIYNLKFTVSDGTFQSAQSFDITILDDGSCGVIPTNLALSAITIIESIPTSSVIAIINATATNPLDVFKFSIVGGRDSASFSISGGNQLVIDHSPNFDVQSSYEIIIGVSDTLHIATKSFEIDVVATESIPAFTSTPIISAKTNSLYQYSLSASDVEGGNFIFSAAPDSDSPIWLVIGAAVTTLAGDGSRDDDDGATSTASFDLPRSVAIDASGNIIVADANNHRIRSISMEGVVSTIAGSSTSGFVNGASTTARFNSPRDVAIDALGNIIVTDRGNHSIRKITPDGMVSTIAGSNTGSFVNGASATARFRSPTGVTIDAFGNIIVTDQNNHRIRSIDPDGMVSTIAGSDIGFADGASATAEFDRPWGVTIDVLGNIIVADSANNRIRSISTDGIVSTIAGSNTVGTADGASATARFNNPTGVAVDAGGNIIVTDSRNNRIRSIDPDGIVTTIAGSSAGFTDGVASNAEFFRPVGVAIDASGNIIIADQSNSRIRQIDRNNFTLVGTPSCDDIGIYNLKFTVSDGTFQSAQSFDIAVADDGSCGAIPTNLSLSVTTIIENIATNSIIATISADDSDNPASLTFSIVGGEDGADFSIASGNQLVIDHSPNFEDQSSYEIIIGVSDTLHIATRSFVVNVVDIVNEIAPVFTSAPITTVRVNSLYQYILDASDVDSSNFIFSVAPEIELPSWLAIVAFVTTLAGDGIEGSDDGATSTASFSAPSGVVVDASGDIIVTDSNNHRIRRISTDGTVSTIAGSEFGFVDGVSTTARFASPTGVAIDASGDIIVADQGNHRIRRISTGGTVSTIAGSSQGFTDGIGSNAQFDTPIDVAIDSSGDIIVADTNNSRIRRINSDREVSTIITNQFIGGNSSVVILNFPTSVAIDVGGNIIVISGHTIYRISLDDIVSTVAGSDMSGFVDGIGSNAQFDTPIDIAIDSSGDVIVADTNNGRIRRISSSAEVRTIITSQFIDGDRFNYPAGVAIDASENIIVADRNNNRIRKIGRSSLVGTPLSCDNIGTYDLELIVSDGELRSSQSFNIRVISDGSCFLVAPFSFDAINDAAPRTIVTSDAIIVATNTQDPQSTFTISIEGSNGRYSINDGSYTDLSGVVNIGDSVRVQIVTSNQPNSSKTATVTIDNIAAAFTVTTTNFIIIGGDSTASYSDLPITISATNSDITTIPIIWTSSATNVVSFSNPNIGLITIVNAGSALITARQGDNEANIVFTVEPLTLTPIFASSQSFIYNTSMRTVFATITSGIVVGDDISLSISGATATDVGNYNIDLALIGTDSQNYRLSTDTLSWSIIKADQSAFNLGADTTIVFGNSLSRSATGVSATISAISYGSSNPSVATVATNGDITTTGVGSTIISAINTGDNNYNSASDSYTLNVAQLTLTIAIGSTTNIYSGAAIIVTTTITNLVSGYELVSLIINGDQIATNAGDYSFDISAIEGSDSPNYILIPTTISWTIVPARQSELDITGNATRLMVGQITTATATNNQPQGTLTIISSETGITTINASTITAINVGITTITITKQVANYNNISNSYQLVVIQNTTTPIDAGDDRTATYIPSGIISPQIPTNAQDRVISYAINPIDSDVVTIDSNSGVITIINVGTVNIIASAATTTNYAASTDSYLLTINQAIQGTFTITASDTLTFGTTSAIVVVDLGSGDGTITYDSSDIAIATITVAGIITATGVGEAIITATRDGGRNYLNTSATHSLVVERAEQANFVISGSSTLANAATGFASATGGSGTGAISFASTNSDVATISQDGIITAQSLGTTTISAIKSGGDNYHDISGSYLLTITNTTPTVTNLIPNQIASLGNLFTFPIPANTFNDANGDTLTISVSALPPSLTFDGINSITGIPATLGISTITITADDGNGAMVSTSFSLRVSDDFIIVGNNPRNIVYGAASQNIIAQGGVSPTGAITFASSTPSITSFSDTNIGELTISSAGTAIIIATREGSGEQASISFIVSPRTITPTFASSQTFIYNTNIRTVLITITSGIVGTDDVSLSISGTATATDVGNYNIDLVLIGTASRNYRLSTTTLSWSIIKADQSQFSLGADTTIIFGEGLSRRAIGVSTTVASSYGSSNPDVATVDTNGDITTTGIGSTIISATSIGDNNYNSAADSYTLNVAPLTLTIAIGSTTTIYTGAAIIVTTTITNLVSGYELVSLTINGDQIATNAGDYSFNISAIEGSDSPNYILIPITISWTIDPAQQSELDITGNATRLMVGQTTIATATNDQPQGTLTISASEAGIATINGSTITASNVGITTITITKQVANHNDISASYQLVVIQNTTAAIDAGDDRTATYTPNGALSAQTPTNTQGRVISYAVDPIASDVATININTGAITITNAGTVSIVVSAAATTNYAASTDSYLLTINQAAQEPFTITASDTLIFGATSAIVVVDPGSGDGTITYDSSDIAIATITTDGIITAIGAGEATITATRDGGRNYLDTSATHLLVVERADQVVSIIGGTLSIDYAPNGATAVGRTATAQTTITYSSTDEDVAIVGATSGIITIVNVGTVNIVASATRTSGYNSAVASYQLIIRQVAQGPFSINASDTLIFGATSAVVIVDLGSGDGVVSYDSSNIAVITITADGIITATGVGEATITATKAGGINYLDTSDTHLITVRRASQTSLIISGNSTLANAATGFATATGGSGTGVISFRSSNPDVATITQDGIISAQSLGTTTISATKSGGDNYRDIGASYLLTIVNTTPTVINPITNQTAPLRNPFTFTIPANTFNDANGDTLTISVSNLPDGLMFDSANTSITGTPATVGISTITITADDGNGAMVSTSFSLAVSDDFIIIGNNPRTIIYGVASQNIVAQGGASLTGAITFVSSTPSIANFGDANIGVLTILGVGTAIITATRDGTGEQASISFIVSPRTITPTFASSQTFIYNTNIRTVLATITNGIVGTDDVSLSVSGATATDVGNYNIDLVLIGAASRNYRLSTTTLSWSIIKADQSQFSLGADTTITFGEGLSRPATGVSATVASSYGSSNPSVAMVATNGDITTIGIGSTIISATNTGDNNYNSAADSYTLNVVQLTLTIATSSTTIIYTGAAIAVTTTITNLVSGYERVSLTINGDQTATNTGDYSFDISAIEGSDSPNYILIPTTISWTIDPAEQSELDITGNATRLMVGQTTIATATNDQPQGTLTIISSEAGIATINASTIIASNVGITTITITKQVANHNDISASYQLVVIQNTTTPIDAGDDRTATYTPNGALSAQAPTNTQGRIISYAVNPIDSDVAIININTGAITITNVGTVSIVVSAVATTNYATSTDTYLLTINQATQEPFTIIASDTLMFSATSAIVVVEPGSGEGTISYAASPSGIIAIDANGIISAIGTGRTTITATRDGGRNYLSTSATHLLIVERADQSQFSLGADTTITFGTSFSRPAIGASATVATSYGSSNHNVATVATNGDITIIGVGSTIISATNTGDNNYNFAAASYQLIITQAPQDPFSITASDTLIFGATTTITIVEGGSGDGVVSYDSSDIAVIAITADGSITATGVGIATITATKAGGINYLDTSDTHLIMVRRASQTSLIISGSLTLANAATGFASATGGSGTGAISFSSSNPDIATITQDGVITAKSLGITTISATKSGGDNYHDTGDNYLLTIVNTTPTVANSIANQIISLRNLFNFIIPANTFNDPNGDTLTISASNLPDGLMFDSANTSITGTPTTVGISIITITADDGNGAMVSTSFSLTVSDDFIIIGNNPRTIIYGVASQNIIAQGGVSPDGAVTFASSTPSVANFGDTNIGELTISSAGTTIITATREGSGEQASISIIISPRTITPTFTSPQTFIYNTNIRTVLITITSGIIAGDDVSLSITGATATDVGNYNIDLGLIGANSLNYRLSTTTLSWSIIKADQSAFSLGADTTITFGEGLSRPVTGVSATVASSYSSSNPDVATVTTNGNITTTGVGSTIISASNTGDNNYNSAADGYTLNVAQLTLTIATGSTTTIYSGAAITVTTTITNLVSGHEQVSLTINGDQTATNAGDYSFDISAIEGIDSPNYILIPTTINWVVASAQQSELDITGNATRLTVGQTTTATATNDQPQGTLTIISSEAGIVTIDGSTITATNVGITTITITKQVVNHNNISASYQLVVIQNTTAAIDAGDDRVATYAPSGALSAQTPTNTRGRVISYAADPMDSDVAIININTGAITITNAGTVSIIVSAAATTNYAASTDSYLLTINQANQGTFTITASDTLTFGATSAVVVVDPGSGDGTITYSSSDIAIATIATDGIITATGAGEATITATRDGGRNYLDTSATHLLVVERADQVVSIIGGTLSIDYAPDGATAAGRIATARTTITYSSTDEDVAIVGATSGIITIVNVGTISIVASATRTSGYNSAVASYQLIIGQVAQGPFSITASDTLIFGVTSAVVIVEPGSGDGVVSYDSSNIAVITITANGIITATGVGEAIITATRDGGRNYLNISATHSIMVERAEQADFVISGSSTLANAATSFATTTGGSGTGAISFRSSNPDIATITQDGIITAQSLGTTTISATKSGGDNYHDIGDSYLLTIINTTPTVANPIANQIASFGNPFTFTIPANTFNDANGDDLAISVSSLPDGLIFDSTNTSITGTPATVGISTITITADDGNGAMVSTSFSLRVSDDFIIIGNNPRIIIYGVASQNIIAQGGVSPAGAITFASSTPSIANFGDANIGELTILGAGTVIITATREGSGEQASVSFIVSPRTITPTFASSQTFTYDTSIRTVLVTITSGIIEGDDISFTISGATAIDVGNYNIGLVLTGASSLNYRLSTTTLSWLIIKADQVLTYASNTISINYKPNNATATSQDLAGAQTTISYTTSPTTSDVATIDDSDIITILNAGSVVIIASATETNNYNPEAASYLLIINPIDQVGFIIIVSSPLELEATTTATAVGGQSTGAISFTSSNPAVAIIAQDGLISAQSLGTTTISATREGGRNYNDISDSALLEVVVRFTLDIDGDGSKLTTTDGILIIRYLTSTNTFTTTGATTTDAVMDAQAIKNSLAAAYQGNILDVDGDGTTEASSDGMLIMRYLADQENLNVGGLVGSSPTRSPEEIREYLEDIY